MADVICLGELLIDFVPTTTGLGLADAELFKKAAGGAPANVAVGVARLGVTSGFMGMVGEDGFGRFLATTLAGAGVDVTTLRFSEVAHTTLAFVSLAADGEREFLFYRHPGADMLFAPADVDEAAIGRARLLHFGSISLIGEPARAATLHAVATARRHGKRVSYDPNLRLALWPDEATARAGLLLGLRHADIVKIGEEEITFLTGIADPLTGARALWHPGLQVMAVTRGSNGCLWVTSEASGEVPGFRVEAVDTTGAGDAFMAGLLAGLVTLPGGPLEPGVLDRICMYASAAGAITVMSRGAIPSLPAREAVLAFLAARGIAGVGPGSDVR
jgi:fructokinase